MSSTDPLVNALAIARRRSGMSQTEVAAAMGTQQSQVSEFETGIHPDPRLSTVRRYAAAIGVELCVAVRPATPASAGAPEAPPKDLQQGGGLLQQPPPDPQLDVRNGPGTPTEDHACALADTCRFDDRCPNYALNCSRFEPHERTEEDR